MNYTKGKWENAGYSPYTYTGINIISGNDALDPKIDIAIVAEYPKAENSMEQKSNGQGNANLIAAAPDMYEALKAMIDLIGDGDLPDNGELSGAAISDMAISAIAKAEGREVK